MNNLSFLSVIFSIYILTLITSLSTLASTISDVRSPVSANVSTRMDLLSRGYLVFEDNFNGRCLDESKWQFDTGCSGNS